MRLEICNLKKKYEGKTVLDGVSFTLEEGEGLCLMGASGCGKTTLLRILMRLEKPDEGAVRGILNLKISAVFQEDRLLDDLSAVKNVWLVCGSSEEAIRHELSEILPAESLDQPVCQLSGGMRRRVSLVRAAMKKSDLSIMDEPFTGLDGETKRAVIEYMKKKIKGKMFLFSTHQEEDAQLFGTKILRLETEHSSVKK